MKIIDSISKENYRKKKICFETEKGSRLTTLIFLIFKKILSLSPYKKRILVDFGINWSVISDRVSVSKKRPNLKKSFKSG